MKILFIGARLFDDISYYLKEKGIHSILTESNKDAINLDLADEYYLVSRGMEEPLKIAIKENVDAVIPLIGIDIPLLDVAYMKEHLEKKYNIPVISSNVDVIKISSDKLKTKEFFNKHGIKTPNFKIITKNNINQSFNFPLVLKQFEGQGGNSIEIANDLKDINNYLDKYGEALCEEFIEGSEISVEVIGFNGDYIALTPIYKGETTFEGTHPLFKNRSAPFQSEKITNEEIKNNALCIAKKLKSEGITEVEFILSSDNSKLNALEINSRPNGVRYLTSASSDVTTLLKLVDMATGDFSTLKIKNEIKNYFSFEKTVGNFLGPKPNEPLKSFRHNDYIVHGPKGYERVTVRAKSKESLNKLISNLKLI
ncbi:MAG: ATP-grasp domain-containing protein [Methanobacteriaceae archaeon]|jgi:carbamoylphosphate synthase large subunit|nr:ATP-grasp domain-containing protein [Methanobacteriaceae archaeon]